MAATTLLIALALAQPQPGAVTDLEKKEFFKLLGKLPARGEFFTAESVTKAIPYTRVLLALTEEDLKKRELYPLFALSRGLIDRKEPSQYAIAHFDKIAHPELKLFWGAVLFNAQRASPEMIGFLRKALDSKEQSRSLAEMSGPNFEEFRDRLIRTYELARPVKIELVKRHTINAFAEYGGGLDYTNESYVFGPDAWVYAVRPLQQGEITAYHVPTGQTTRLRIAQPAGFKARFDFSRYFARPGSPSTRRATYYACGTSKATAITGSAYGKRARIRLWRSG